ncbi:AMP-binding protein [Cytobacillus pseudoceanisediminis]|nr:AMP-binding protein [Cytobacillus pseudoceanisediminis]
MNQVLDDVNKTVDSLQLKDEKETKKTVIHGRTLKQKITGPFTLHEQFEKQVLIYGNKIAVRSENDAYTYKELNRRSNQLAAHLVEKGLTTGQHVAVMMERSADLVIAILGILKAGGVYVPIDKHMPEERIRYILHDSEARFMIVGKKGRLLVSLVLLVSQSRLNKTLVVEQQKRR